MKPVLATTCIKGPTIKRSTCKFIVRLFFLSIPKRVVTLMKFSTVVLEGCMILCEPIIKYSWQWVSTSCSDHSIPSDMMFRSSQSFWKYLCPLFLYYLIYPEERVAPKGYACTRVFLGWCSNNTGPSRIMLMPTIQWLVYSSYAENCLHTFHTRCNVQSGQLKQFRAIPCMICKVTWISAGEVSSLCQSIAFFILICKIASSLIWLKTSNCSAI